MKKKALIVWGGWEGHDPENVAKLFAEKLAENDFEVEMSHTLDSFADGEKLKGFNLIIPIWTMGSIDEKYVQNVMGAVENGVGLAGCHGGMCDSFRSSTDWQFLTGSQWVAHPGGDGVQYTVKPKDGVNDPIIEGIREFPVISEQYYIHVDPAAVVLAVTTFPVADGPYTANGTADVPVVYKKRWGKGKVFYNSLGHTAKVFSDSPEGLTMMTRGMLWAAK